jgi:hypothetical protein
MAEDRARLWSCHRRPRLDPGLTSPDVNVRNDAWSKLHGNIWHQGTIYEATSYAMPVFLELLRQPATPGKHDVLAFLALLFTARSYRDVHQHRALLQSEVGKPRVPTEVGTGVSLRSGHQGCCGQRKGDQPRNTCGRQLGSENRRGLLAWSDWCQRF